MSMDTIYSVSMFALILHQVCGQDACMELTSADLGTSDTFSGDGLVSHVLTLTPSVETSDPVDVRILDMNIVCEAQHTMQDRYRYTSVVVSFNCMSTDSQLPECADNSALLIEQFDFGCVGGQWTPAIFTISTLARTRDPTATLTTPEDNSCLVCINPKHPVAGSVDSVTHCQACSESCVTGLQRCYLDGGTEVCCNYFHNGVCVTECPPNYGPNEEFVCQPQCAELMVDNGDFTYDGGRFVGSRATLTCATGYEVTDSPQAECLATRNWSRTPMCNASRCGDVDSVDFGDIVYSSSKPYIFGTIARLKCDPGFVPEEPVVRTCMPNRLWEPNMKPTCTMCSDKVPGCTECTSDKDGTVTCIICETNYILEDGECKTLSTAGIDSPQASTCDPPCIIGIVVAVLALMIVVAVVAFVLYKFLNDPATKSAKKDTSGLNGTAHENPLYFEPAAVTEDCLDEGATEITPFDSEV